jgi:hypothetical protein
MTTGDITEISLYTYTRMLHYIPIKCMWVLQIERITQTCTATKVLELHLY